MGRVVAQAAHCQLPEGALALPDGEHLERWVFGRDGADLVVVEVAHVGRDGLHARVGGDERALRHADEVLKSDNYRPSV